MRKKKIRVDKTGNRLLPLLYYDDNICLIRRFGDSHFRFSRSLENVSLSKPVSNIPSFKKP